VSSVTRGSERGDAAVQDVETRPSRRRRRNVALALIVVVGIWALAVIAILLSGRGHMVEAERTLPAARAAVADADFETAAATVREAHDALSSAADAFDNPLLLPLRAVPIVRTDLHAVRTIARSGAAVTDDASELIAVIEAQPDGLNGLAPKDGAFPVDRFQQLAGPMRATAHSATSAIQDIQAAPTSGWVAQIDEGRTRILDLLEPLVAQFDLAALLADQLPRFLGADGPRTYLFGASTPAELRGTGGFIGSIALLRIDEGRLEFGSFEASSELSNLPPDQLPAPVEEDAARWARYGGTGVWVNLNRTADFPSAAQAMLSHWEATDGVPLDGMLVADPFALKVLLELAGPAEVPGYGVTLDADSVVPFVTNEAYAEFESADERKAVLGAVSAATLGRFLEGGVDAPADALVSKFASIVAGGHLLAFATDPDVQSAFVRGRAAGELGDAVDPPSDLVNVALNSGTASKVDFYTDRSMVLETTLLEGGKARTDLLLRLANDAPIEGVDKYVIGPNNPTLDAGDNLVNVSVYLTSGAQFFELPQRHDGPTFAETELGYPVHDGWVRIPSGQAVERRYSWRTPDAWEQNEDGELVYDLLVQGQTVIRPTDLTIRVRIPPDLEVVDPPAGAEVDGDVLRWSREVRGEDVRLRLRLQFAGQQ
jgi:hypothetical protein